MSTQEQPRGIVGTIKEKLGLAVPEETSAEQVVKEKIAAPTTPGREGPVCAPDQVSERLFFFSLILTDSIIKNLVTIYTV